MLLVPPTKQPHSLACLPTCVWAVLKYLEREPDYEEIDELCLPGPFGALQYVALQSLREAGYEVDEVEELEVADIERSVSEGRPLIVSLPPGGQHTGRFGHAVVICGLVDEETLRVMDPSIGDYRDLPLRQFLVHVQRGLTEPFYIGFAIELGPHTEGPSAGTDAT